MVQRKYVRILAITFAVGIEPRTLGPESRKTEAILFSRNRKHWRDRLNEHVTVQGRQVPFNRKATRWLGIWVDSRLSWKEHIRIYEGKARRAERRISSLIRRNGVPQISVRHLQEAIGATAMYASEVTYRGQPAMERSIQKVINRMARSKLGVMQSTPIPFLMANAGSMPAAPRLRARQKAFAVRTAASENPEIRGKTTRGGPLSRRIRDLAQEQGIKI